MKRFAPLIAILAGVLFVTFGIINIKKQQAYTGTTATITSIDYSQTAGDAETDTTRVYVTYTVEGNEITSQLDTYSASMKVGKTIKVAYDPENPTDVILKSNVAPILYFVIGALGFFGGAFYILKHGFR